jgi:hypothetical protein
LLFRFQGSVALEYLTNGQTCGKYFHPAWGKSAKKRDGFAIIRNLSTVSETDQPDELLGSLSPSCPPRLPARTAELSASTPALTGSSGASIPLSFPFPNKKVALPDGYRFRCCGSHDRGMLLRDTAGVAQNYSGDIYRRFVAPRITITRQYHWHSARRLTQRYVGSGQRAYV